MSNEYVVYKAMHGYRKTDAFSWSASLAYVYTDDGRCSQKGCCKIIGLDYLL